VDVVIDLGVVRDAPEADWRSPPVRPRTRRWIAAAAAVAAVLAAGAAEPVRGRLVEMTVPVVAARAFAGPGGLYLIDGDTISKYEVPGGRIGWRVSVPQKGRAQTAFMVGEMLLIMADQFDSRTVAIDGETGEERWRRAGVPVFMGDDEDMAVLIDRRPGTASVRYEAVEIATGAVLWELTGDEGDEVFSGTGRFVRWSLPDRVEVRDLGTGRVLTIGTVQPPADGGPGLSGDWDRRVVGDLLLVARYRDGKPVAEAYDLERLVPRWTADIDLTLEQVADCGDLLCVDHSTGARVLEADTGRVRWSRDQPGLLERVGPVILSYDHSQQPARIRTLDLADGHVRADLGPWEIGWGHDDDGRVMATQTAREGGSWIAEIDLIEGRVRILGVTHDAFECQPGRVVICKRLDGTIGVWYPTGLTGEP